MSCVEVTWPGHVEFRSITRTCSRSRRARDMHGGEVGREGVQSREECIRFKGFFVLISIRLPEDRRVRRNDLVFNFEKHTERDVRSRVSNTCRSYCIFAQSLDDAIRDSSESTRTNERSR